MAKLTPVGSKKRKIEDAMRGKTSKPKKRIKKQKNYHSSSEDEQDEQDGVGFAPVNLADSDDDAEPTVVKKSKREGVDSAPAIERVKRKEAKAQESESDDDDAEEEKESDTAEDKPEATVSKLSNAAESEPDSESGSDSDTQSTTGKKKKSKRNDPEAFATSMSKILNTKLTTTQKKDPVLSRSVAAIKSRQEATDSKLEAKARTRLRAEKQLAMQKGRTTDVLGIERGISGQVAEKEKQLRKIATKGVVQLFNAFRGAYEKAEQTRQEEYAKGTVGMGERGRKVGEVGKEEFLERIAGKKAVST